MQASVVNDQGEVLTQGVVEYTTEDGWAGIREESGRLDEWPVEWIDAE